VKKYKIKVDLYGDVIILHLCPAKEYNKILKNCDLEILDEDCLGQTARLHGVDKYGRFGYYSIWMEKFKGTPKCYGILAHEIAHVVMGILNRRGVLIHVDNAESVTHLQGYITEALIRKMRR